MSKSTPLPSEGPSTILPTLWPLCSVQKQRILSPFSPLSEGHEDVFEVHSCLEMFQPSSEGDLIEILIDENLVGLKQHSQFLQFPLQAQVFELLSGLQMACFAGIQPGLKCLRLYWCEKPTASLQFRANTRKLSK